MRVSKIRSYSVVALFVKPNLPRVCWRDILFAASEEAAQARHKQLEVPGEICIDQFIEILYRVT